MKEEPHTRCWGHLEGIFTQAQSNSGREGIYTYSRVPRLGKQRRKERERKKTVIMAEGESVGGVGNIMTEERRREDRWIFYCSLNLLKGNRRGNRSMTQHVDTGASV